MGNFLATRGPWVPLTIGAVSLVAATGACSGDALKPGFQNLGGSGGSGSSTTASSSRASTTSASGTSAVASGVTASAASTATSATSSAVSSGSGCADPGAEPNETEATATDLGQIGECDNMGSSISGVLHDAFDVDWFKYHGIDGSILCSVDPARHINNTNIRLCKYIQCDGSEANNFSCPSGTSQSTSPDGRPGCCTMSGDIHFDLTCGSSSLDADNAEVFIRVDNPNQLPCEAYQVDYHY